MLKGMELKTYLTSLCSKELPSIEYVLQALINLDAALVDGGWPGLRNFNQAYLIITRNVLADARRGGFDNPTFLTTFDTCFAGYYFRALRNYIHGEQTPAAWFVAFDRAQSGKISSLKAMALGVNAHVNNDIAQVLMELDASHKQYGDYKRVNDVIHHSIYEVFDSLDADQKWLNSRYQKLRPLYRVVLHILIRAWRAHAWQTYKRAQRSSSAGQELTHKLNRQAYIIGRGTDMLPI